MRSVVVWQFQFDGWFTTQALLVLISTDMQYKLRINMETFREFMIRESELFQLSSSKQ